MTFKSKHGLLHEWTSGLAESLLRKAVVNGSLFTVHTVHFQYLDKAEVRTPASFNVSHRAVFCDHNVAKYSVRCIYQDIHQDLKVGSDLLNYRQSSTVHCSLISESFQQPTT